MAGWLGCDVMVHMARLAWLGVLWWFYVPWTLGDGSVFSTAFWLSESLEFASGICVYSKIPSRIRLIPSKRETFMIVGIASA